MTDTLEAPTTDEPRLPEYNARRLGFTAGVIAAAAMLVAIVILRLLSGVESLPEIFAEGILVNLPGALFSAVLDSLQHSAKPLFFLAIAIGILIVGGLLGRWYSIAPTPQRAAKIVAGVWAVFGLIVYTLLGAGIFGQHLQAGPLWHGLSLLLVFGVYGVALWQTYALLAHRALPDLPDVSRRDFLRNAAVLTVATVGAGSLWRLAMGGDISTETVPVPAAAGGPPTLLPPNSPPYDLKGISPEITDVSDFYTVSKNFIDPSVAVGGWKLTIDGLVDNPMSLSYDQLTALPPSDGYYTLMCISNEIGGDLWGNAAWRGVSLKWLLEQAGVHTDAYKAVFSAADDYKDSVMLANALNPDALLAWEMNGQPLKKEHGYPARLLIPGIYGMKNVKWLTGISIVSADFKGFWQQQGWDDAAPYQTESRIDVPKSRDTITAGPLSVGGVAFAGNRGISSVEVSTDGEKTWLPAQVKPGLSGNTWQLWRADINVDSAVRDIRVRATDGTGKPQTRQPADPFPSGATGYDSVRIAVS
ncbi:MAG TPA: molybdopterin-dependent oxidoreductase [Chloroflexota bacterium]|jgi:DMSO/TMAO reductase YedYZ molybdopterin-dependent catalytic subunit